MIALDFSQNFVSAKYLENKLTEFHQILYMHLYWQDLGWDCYTSFFTNLYQHYRPWFTAEFRLRTLSWAQIDRFITKYPYALILTRLRLGLLRHFSLIYTRAMALNVLCALILTRFRLGLYMSLRSFVPELWPLNFARISSFPLNILRTNWQIFTKFYICIYIDKI